MAASDRTEKPTPKRRREARRKGQVARSNDLNGAFVLVAALLGLSVLAPEMFDALAGSMRDTLARMAHPDVTSAAGLQSLFDASLHTVIAAAAPMALVCIASG